MQALILVARTTDPAKLLSAIRAATRASAKRGSIATWDYDDAGDFFHTAQQWIGKAWLHPDVKSGALVMSILVPDPKNVAEDVLGVYLGRFAEMLINHFPKAVSAIELP